MNSKRMPINCVSKIFLPVWVLALGFAALMLSCSNDSTTPPNEPRAWYYESEFAQNPGLVARPEQVVILDIMPGEVSTEHEIPYQYEEGGGYLFAIESDDPFIIRAEVFDRSGTLVADTERGDGGVYLNMTPNSYSMKVYHDGADVPEEGSIAFVRRQIAGTVQSAEESDILRQGEGNTMLVPEYPKYAALQIVGGDYDSQYLIIDTVNCDPPSEESYTMFRAVPINTKEGPFFKDRRHLFTFKNDSTGRCPDPPPTFTGSYNITPFTSSEPSEYLVIYSPECYSCPLCPASQKTPGGGVWVLYFSYVSELPVSSCVQNMGDGSICLWSYMNFVLSSPLYVAENGYMYWTQFSYGKDPDNLKMVNGFTYYKDGTQLRREDLKKDEVALYEGENYTGVAVVLSKSFSNTTLISMDQVRSVAFGIYTDTTVQFFGKTGFSDLIRTVGIDTPTSLDIDGGDIASIKIFDSRKVLISSKKCPYCNLADVNLSDLNLDNADLTNANLMDASVHNSSMKKANLSHTFLNGANLTNSNLSGATLLGASLNGDSNLNLAAATLTGAYLKNVNCKGADLGGADFTNASFHTSAVSYTQDGCAQDPNNPGYTNNCASAQGANMAGATFISAYLAGTDFSGATADGASFEDAVLTGAIFKSAHLDWNSATSRSTNFTGAFIGGTNYTNATVEGANFESAYLNLSPKEEDYCIYFTVSAVHTQFPDFDDQHGDSPCVMFAYSGPTVVPDTDSNNTCPDGSSGPCDTTVWTSPVTPKTESPWVNSSCGSQPEWCKQINWDW